jgi:hypothetical protein
MTLTLKSLNIIFSLPVLIIMLLGSCDAKRNTQKGTDLLKYGIPYTLDAPEQSTITKSQTGRLAAVNVKDGHGYDVQVFMSDANTNNLIKLKQDKKDAVTAHPAFNKIIEEFDQGFIYEKKDIEGDLSFDFELIVIQGDKEINFQAGNSKLFTEAEVKIMVKSILK